MAGTLRKAIAGPAVRIDRRGACRLLLSMCGGKRAQYRADA